MMRSASAISPIRFLPAAGMMAAIFYVSAQPGDQLQLPEWLPFDKAWHMLEYGIFAALCLFALYPRVTGRNVTAIVAGVIVFATVYGISDEFHQSFVPLRTSSASDVVADCLGAALVTVTWRWWFLRRLPTNK